jgi:hypothetical protein
LKYVLDTNTVSALMKDVPRVATLLEKIPRADVAISQVIVAEIEFGLRYVLPSKRAAGCCRTNGRRSAQNCFACRGMTMSVAPIRSSANCAARRWKPRAVA